jgi:hypothetical protein
MGRKYSGITATIATGTNKTLQSLQSATTIRPRLYEIIMGSNATPADQACQLSVLRFTAVGTAAGTFTPVAIDPGDPASLAVINQGVFSGEPTYTANSNLLLISMNQRATFRWIVNPGYELIAPATANAGLGIKTLLSTSTQTMDTSFSWEE